MIYIIDEKKNRQEDFGWDTRDFSEYRTDIQTIHQVDEFIDKQNEILKGGNTVLYHESFLDNTEIKNKAQTIRKEFEYYAEKHPDFYLVVFSGSKSSRSLNKNIAYVPVSVVYQNLKVFVIKVLENDVNLKYLLFGENPEIEEYLAEKLLQANSKIDTYKAPVLILNSKNIYLRPIKDNIQKPIENAKEITLFNNVSDEELTKKIIEWLSVETYDNIFIPICFGPVMSDFNGLRLAAHIRCTETRNQLMYIYIYSFVGIDDLIQNEYFNILKTKNVKLIDHTKEAFELDANQSKSVLSLDDLSTEIFKLKLDIPKDYEDNHSISNEWAIYQWANVLGISNAVDFESVFKRVESNIYFKYLKSISKVSIDQKIDINRLHINKVGKFRVLLIDDESEKGWYEIFAYILGDRNDIYVDSIGDEFRGMSQEEIISQSIEKIEKDDIDLVILDFRLHPKDFSNSIKQEITSVKLLRKIKELNPGIQVIIFSATNKVWNLQALLAAGADSFFIKDTTDNVRGSIFTIVKVFENLLKRSSWLKMIWSKTESSLDHLKDKKQKKEVDKDYLDAVSTFLKLGFNSLINTKSEYKYDSAFIYYFLILEASAKQFIDEENPVVLDGNKNNDSYKFKFRNNDAFLKSFKYDSGERTTYDYESNSKRINYNQKFLNLMDYANVKDIDIYNLISLRNDFIHPNLVKNKSTAKIGEDEVKNLLEVCSKLLDKL